jgi:cytidylate kinase
VTRNKVPIITIDGPSGSGKGTISRRIAHRLAWHLLDSGALYRLVALAARRQGLSLANEVAVADLAAGLDFRFESGPEGAETRILLGEEDVTEAVRSEQCGNDASTIAVLPRVRRALLDKQRIFSAPPGLVADGRDMGTVVFPAADLKIFLTASREERAERRHKQLKEKGVDVSLTNLLEDIARRDARDHSRPTAPMKPASDAVLVDTTALGIDEVVSRIVDLWRDRSEK